ncbi:hypothetical protein BJ138DRAFT_753126 [Hygrophoropsis aurantiaca]|uniref:Uncharacterized protein n=1 Tax=Hygrophoropsis aurantiaca TaxID=72124 RepID=A0ACB7ZWT9_9AGAM|nr:hypothetical protein BJ138DRAFT_753126 [Hygrophoropsis aurantiaca]
MLLCIELIYVSNSPFRCRRPTRSVRRHSRTICKTDNRDQLYAIQDTEPDVLLHTRTYRTTSSAARPSDSPQKLNILTMILVVFDLLAVVTLDPTSSMRCSLTSGILSSSRTAILRFFSFGDQICRGLDYLLVVLLYQCSLRGCSSIIYLPIESPYRSWTMSHQGNHCTGLRSGWLSRTQRLFSLHFSPHKWSRIPFSGLAPRFRYKVLLQRAFVHTPMELPCERRWPTGTFFYVFLLSSNLRVISPYSFLFPLSMYVYPSHQHQTVDLDLAVTPGNLREQVSRQRFREDHILGLAFYSS